MWKFNSKMYIKEWNNSKHKFNSGVETVETQHVKKVSEAASDRLYKKQGKGTCASQ